MTSFLPQTPDLALRFCELPAADVAGKNRNQQRTPSKVEEFCRR
jgi:hypothetical protein